MASRDAKYSAPVSSTGGCVPVLPTLYELASGSLRKKSLAAFSVVKSLIGNPASSNTVNDSFTTSGFKLYTFSDPLPVGAAIFGLYWLMLRSTFGKRALTTIIYLLMTWVLGPRIFYKGNLLSH